MFFFYFIFTTYDIYIYIYKLLNIEKKNYMKNSKGREKLSDTTMLNIEAE